MQLDKTNISISERSIFGILDLSLHVVRDYFVPIAICLILGVVPFAVLNYFLCYWMLDFELGVTFPYRYIWITIYLITIESPLATIFVTAYLGQAVFSDQPTLRGVIGQVMQETSKLLVSTGIIRGLIPSLLLFFFILPTGEFRPEIELMIFFFIMFFVLVMRCFRPYVNEIIVL